MKFEALKQSLEREILPAYFITGEDIFLMYRALTLIENACVPMYKDLNYTTFTPENKNTIEEIIDSLNNLPLMDKKRLVVLKGSSLKKNTHNAKVLEAYLKKPNPNCCFVYFDSTPNELFNAYKGFFELVDCNKLSKTYVKQFILKELSIKKATITEDAFDLLYDNCDGLLSEMVHEAHKLAALAPGGAVTKTIVDQNTEKTFEYQVFELSDAISKRQKDKTIKIVNKLMLNRDTREAIIPTLLGQFNRALHARLNGNTQLISKELGAKEYAIIKSKEMAMRFSQKELKQIFDLIFTYDHKTKTGALSLENAITLLIDEILTTI